MNGAPHSCRIGWGLVTRFGRITRRFFTLCWALSLLLCVATIALWVRSYRVRDEWTRDVKHAGWPESRAGWSVSSDHGQVAIVRIWPIPQPPSDSVPTAESMRPGTKVQWQFPIIRRESWSGVGVTVREMRLNMAPVGPSNHLYGRTIFAGHWVVVLLSGAMPVWALMRFAARWRVRTRVRRGLCSVCGYDLRGAPQRCPECGAVPDSGTMQKVDCGLPQHRRQLDRATRWA
jgi:hypothetical protein